VAAQCQREFSGVIAYRAGNGIATYDRAPMNLPEALQIKLQLQMNSPIAKRLSTL
jgi:hypothetical protein